MRFGISNLVWPQLPEEVKTRLLSSCAICDFAPTIHFPDWRIPDSFSSNHYGSGLRICALQSLLFNIPDASLVRSDDEFAVVRTHLRYLFGVAQKASIPMLIYGSPGTRSKASVDLLGPQMRQRVRLLAEDAATYQVKLCFEVNSPRYGCEFLCDNEALFALLDDLRHPGLGLHLDVGQLIEEGREPATLVSQRGAELAHIHLSAPDFSLRSELLPLYREVIAAARAESPSVDVVLEVQKLGDRPASELADLCEVLAAEF